MQAVPLGKVIFHLSPPTSTTSPAPLSPSGVIFNELGEKRKDPSGFVPDYLSVVVLSAYDWCIAHKHVCEWNTHTGFPSLFFLLCHTHDLNRHICTRSVMCNYLVKIATVTVLLKISTGESGQHCPICFLQWSLVSGSLQSDSWVPVESRNLLLKDGLSLHPFNIRTLT